MIVTFLGVRGSVPVPGRETLRYGGNTSCVAVEADGRVLLLDAGTGIRRAADLVRHHGGEAFLVLTHPHADHVQGFPFFSPLYEPETLLHLPDWTLGERRWSLLNLLDDLHLPITPATVRARVEHPDEEADAYLRRHGWDVATLPLNHPGGALGWRIGHRGRVFVHLTDNELRAHRPTTSFEQTVEFCRHADLLSHDAQLADAERAEYAGWGHSTVSDVCDLAIAAGVRRLVLFHHDPQRHDDAVDTLREQAVELLRPHGISCYAASEDLRIDLDNTRPGEREEGKR